jgi:hypothetical protein
VDSSIRTAISLITNRPLNTQAITGLSTLTTIQSTPTLFYPAYTTQENGPPSLPHSPSGCPSPSKAPVLLVKNLPVGTLRTRSCGQFYLNFHQAHAHRHPFPSGMINNYYIHSSMALLFLPFVSMLIPRAHELAIVSEEERTRNKGRK